MAPGNKLANQLAKYLYDLAPQRAIEQNICLRCKKPPRFKTEAGKREYRISGLCEYCFDEEFQDL